MSGRAKAARMIALGLALALALAGCSARPRTSAGAAAPTATSYATPFIAPTTTPIAPGQWTQMGALVGATIAPSDPRIAYQVGLTGVERTADGGATWTDLGAPRISGDSGFIQPQARATFVSPINPNTLFMIVDTFTSSGCGQGAGVYSPGSGGAGEPPTATGSCEAQFVSANQGVAWSRLRLPVPGLVTSILHAPSNNPASGDTQPQGSRLYAQVINQHIGANVSPPPGRLVVSDDGGVGWRAADQRLVAAGQGIYDYAATPGGATIFAITEPLSTKPAMFGPAPKLTLWRSDNAGATWTRPGPLPNNAIAAMRAAQVGATPVLYLQTFDAAGHGYIQASPWGNSGEWQAAPSTGPSGPLPQQTLVLATQPDGSLLVSGGAILAWRWSPRASGWRQVAADPGLSGGIVRALVVTAGGQSRLWLSGATDSATVMEYTVLTT